MTALIAWAMAGCAPHHSPPEPVVEEPPVDLPEPGPLPAYHPPAPTLRALSNGATVEVVHDPALPLVSVRLVAPGGADHDPPDGWGLASLSAQMLTQSAGERDAVEVSAALRLLGAGLRVAVRRQHAVVALDALAEHLDASLDLLADAWLRPAFDATDWDRLRTLQVNGLRQAGEDGPAVAREVARQALFGAAHPEGHGVGGVPATVEGLEVEAARAFHQRRLADPAAVTFVVAGALDPDAAVTALEARFGRTAWPGGGEGFAPLALPETPVDAPPRVFLVDLPGSTQTAIQVLRPAMPPGHPDEPAAGLVGVVLGGSFTSRINHLLREEKGFTYGARAGFQAQPGGGLLVASTAVRADATAEALTDLLGLLAGAGETGFASDEIGRARAQVLADAISQTETRAGLADALAARVVEGRPPDGWGAELDALAALDPEALAAAASRWIRPAGMVVALAGDAATIRPALEAAGYAPEDVPSPY